MLFYVAWLWLWIGWRLSLLVWSGGGLWSGSSCWRSGPGGGKCGQVPVAADLGGEGGCDQIPTVGHLVGGGELGPGDGGGRAVPG